MIGCETLLARAIRKCKESAMVCEVYVSTEDGQIATEAVEAGACVIHRPHHLALDTTTSSDVLLHACEIVNSEIIALVQCTSPFMTVDEINGTILKLIETGAELSIAIAATDALLVTDSGELHGINWDIGNAVTRRQDRWPCYEVCGSIWAFWRDGFLERKTIYAWSSVVGYHAERRFEIDEPIDLQWARGIDLTYCN